MPQIHLFNNITNLKSFIQLFEIYLFNYYMNEKFPVIYYGQLDEHL